MIRNKRMVIIIGKGKHFISIENFQFTSELVEDNQHSKFGVVMTLCPCIIFTSTFDVINIILSKI